MPYIKDKLNGSLGPLYRHGNSLYTQCLGAWYFNSASSVFPDLGFGNHIMTRRGVTYTAEYAGKFNATVLRGLTNTTTPLATADPIGGISSAFGAYNKFSMALWYRSSETEDSDQAFLCCGGSALIKTNYGFYYGVTSEDLLFSTGDNSDLLADSSSVSLDGNWHLIVGTVMTAGTSDRKLYFDGVLTASDTSGVTGISAGTVKVLGDGISRDLINSSVLFAGVWGRELMYSEVKQLYNDPMCMLNYPAYPLGQGITGRGAPDLMPWFID